MLRHCCLLLLLHSVAFAAKKSDAIVNKESYDHIVYVGDSILRYQVLAFLFDTHHHQPVPWNLTFNDHKGNISAPRPPGPKIGKWRRYLLWSTDIFEGHMVCDCYRGEVMGKSRDIFENRFYSHPNGRLFVSYFQKFGDSPAKGKVNKTKMQVYNSLSEANEGLWWAKTYPAFFKQVRQLSPRPTVLILNQKPWVTPFRKSTILLDLPGAMKSALEEVETVLWLQGLPTVTEAQTYKKQKGKYNIGPVDALVRDVLCNPRHPQHVNVTRRGRDVSCIYVPIPKDLFSQLVEDPHRHYHDTYHLADPKMYLRRNNAALKAAGVNLSL